MVGTMNSIQLVYVVLRMTFHRDCHAEKGRVYGDTLGTVVSFEDADEPVG